MYRFPTLHFTNMDNKVSREGCRHRRGKVGDAPSDGTEMDGRMELADPWCAHSYFHIHVHVHPCIHHAHAHLPSPISHLPLSLSLSLSLLKLLAIFSFHSVCLSSVIFNLHRCLSAHAERASSLHPRTCLLPLPPPSPYWTLTNRFFTVCVIYLVSLIWSISRVLVPVQNILLLSRIDPFLCFPKYLSLSFSVCCFQRIKSFYLSLFILHRHEETCLNGIVYLGC